MALNEPEAHQTSGRGTCVILCRPGAAGPAVARSVAIAPPRELISALERKGMSLQVCDSHAEALAELVVHEREMRIGAASRPIVLLLVEPEKTAGVAELLERVNLYAPRAMIWRYSPAHRPPLSAWAPSRPAPAAALSVQTPSPRPAPALRLTDAPPAPSGDRGGVAPQAGRITEPQAAGTSAKTPDSDDSGPCDALDTPHRSSQSPSGPILTQDELSMLLSDDWESHT